MKFKKLSLEEALFDDNFDLFDAAESVSNSEYDDDFSEDMIISDTVDTPLEGPKVGADVGVADMIMTAINDEWNTIRNYNSLMATLKELQASNPEYKKFIEVIEDITAEENTHIGQLQEVLKVISPSATAIEQGAAEGRDQLHIRNMPKIEFWDDVKKENKDKPQSNEISTDCSLADVDDEM